MLQVLLLKIKIASTASIIIMFGVNFPCNIVSRSDRGRA